MVLGRLPYLLHRALSILEGSSNSEDIFLELFPFWDGSGFLGPRPGAAMPCSTGTGMVAVSP